MRLLPGALAIALLVALPSYAYDVDDLGDAGDSNPGDNVCETAVAGPCTLRAAIEEANAHAGADTIEFVAGGVGIISPGTPYPTITEELHIDGSTAPGYLGVPVVIVDGAFSVTIGLDFGAAAASSTLNALQLYGFNDTAVRVSADATTITRNYLGPIPAGTANQDGLQLSGSGSTVGGLSADGNVISGNTRDGILVSGDGHVIAGNRIGVSADGTTALGNGVGGIRLTTADNILIGTTDSSGDPNVISGNDTGVHIESGTGNVVDGNRIGTDAAGTAAVGNGDGVTVESSGNVIGTTAMGNVVSGNQFDGIVILADGTTVRHNIIGLDITGMAGIGNDIGIDIIDASNHDIGGTGANEGNVVSFNTSAGVLLLQTTGTVTDVRIFGNIIGLTSDGLDTRGNGIGVLSLDVSGVLVGSVIPGGRNVVSGNSDAGIVIAGGADNIIENNLVGTDITGAAAQGNLGTGIEISGSNGNIIRENVIGGNGAHGIETDFDADGTVIHHNFIGISSDLSTDLGNFSDGVNVCDGSSNTVVGSLALGGNTIAFNHENGIGIEPTALLNNTWAANSIFENGTVPPPPSLAGPVSQAIGAIGLGIDLERDGVTPNDPLDEDAGPNNLQNFPVITWAVTGGGSSFVQGTINTLANTSVTVHAYGSPIPPDPSNFGEGKTYLGAATVITDASGDASFTIAGPSVAVGDVASTTGTTVDGSSEFSQVLAMLAAPTIEFASATYSIGEEGVSASIGLTRTGDTTGTSTVLVTTSDGTATAGQDYTATSVTATFNPGETTTSINIPLMGDVLDEADETVDLTLSNPVAASLGAQSAAVLTLLDDDAPPAISIDDVTLSEGDSGTTSFTFNISLSAVSGQPVTVDWATAPDTATAGVDYTSVPATQAVIPAGNLSTTVTVLVSGDTTVESNETFFVDLFNPGNATITDGEGLGTINNDDAASISIGDVSQVEGNSLTTTFSFLVTLTNPSDTDVTVSYQTADGTATEPGDYAAASGVATITAGNLTTMIPVSVNGDTTTEPDETFFVDLSLASGATIADAQGQGTIQNDDGDPTISIGDVTQAEGDSLTSAFDFLVTLSHMSSTDVTVTYQTANGTATQPGDYAAASGVATITAGNLTTTIPVTVNGDTVSEADETFFVNLTAPVTGGTISDNQGLGTITNDDVAVAMSDVSVVKTASDLTFTPGQEITYTIDVTNAGPDTAPSVTVTDILPAGTTFVSATSGGATCNGTTTVTCDVPSLASGQTVSISLVVTAGGNVPITNTASAETVGAVDSASLNNAGAVTISPAAAAGAAIPTLSTWALLMLLAGLAGLALKRF